MIPNASEDAEPQKLLQNGAQFVKPLALCSKAKQIQFSNYSLMFIQMSWKHVYTIIYHIYSSFSIYSLLGATKMPFSRWTDKYTVVHLFNEILFGA
jgi:hypothetical protein